MRASLIFLMLLFAGAVFAQQPSKEELERRRKSILEDIRASQEQLANTKKDKNATLSQLRALQSKLDARQRLIGNINDEISGLNSTIIYSQQEIDRLNQNLEGLKARYAQSVRYAYKNRSSYSTLAFLFSSAGYDDAVRRMKYLKRYREYRANQAAEIRFTKTRIADKIGALNVEKTRKDMLRSAEEQQRTVLQQETNETNQVVTQLKGREKELMSDLQQKQKTKQQLDKAIYDVIQREIALARKRAEEEEHRRAEEQRKKEEEARRVAAAARNTYGNGPGSVKLNTGSGVRPASGNPPVNNNNAPSNPGTITSGSVPVATAVNPRNPRTTASASASRDLLMTPEAAQLAANFAANKGRLPWPVEQGVIISSFGKHQHPVYKTIIVDNNGIDIQTSAGAPVRAVYDGVVSAVLYIGGLGQNVIIRHGDYFTVYANLSSVSVKREQEIKTKQVIGVAGTGDENVPMIKFSIYKGTVMMNPELWIAR